MLEPLYQIINSIRPMTDNLREALDASFEIVEVPKRTMLQAEGQTSNYIYVIIKGLLRMYYVKDGEEVCSRFIDEQHLLAMSVSSFYSRQPGYEYIETLEPSVIGKIHYDKLQILYRDFIEFNYTARIITERFYVRSEERLFLLRKQTAEERYLFFSEKYPDLMQRIPLKYIATYLGLTLETLSRIRKKLSEGR